MEVESPNRLPTRMLAIDLENVLVPLASNATNEASWQSFCRMAATDKLRVAYFTAQPAASAEKTIASLGLPAPDALICNSGQTVFVGSADGQLNKSKEYDEHLALRFAIDTVANDRPLKAIAMAWWAEIRGVAPICVVHAGDFEDDALALCKSFCSIVLHEGPLGVARTVSDAHRTTDSEHRPFLAERPAIRGLLDGCRWFDLFPSERPALPDGLGAIPVSASTTHFRVRAPKRKSVAVEIASHSRTYDLTYEGDGYFSGFAPAQMGDRYLYVLDHDIRRPDPTSRFQPNGVHRHSQVVTPHFRWNDSDWNGIPKSEFVIYELHIGVFTEEGTFLSAIQRIPELVELGVTAVELMPIAQSPGKWNWGYDGVNLFAPRASFGTPNDLREFVNACHGAGLAVILDVVYNHLGPEGNYLSDFGQYYSRKHGTPWGEAFDFDGRHKKHVRRFIVENALYWIRDFHLDGLRLDAVHFMFDDSDYTILDEIRDQVAEFRTEADREIHLIAEANVFDRKLAVGGRDGQSHRPYDLNWCDDIMHSVYSLGTTDVSLTRRPYVGATDVAESLQHGFIYTGPQVSRATQESRDALDLPADRSYLSSLVVALQTHDSVGNHPHGKRLHQLTSVKFQKAAAALFLLYPAVPMIFMGEECAAEAPFPFFVDFEDPRLRKRVDRGRAAEYPQHQWDGAISPSDPRAFYSAKCHAQSIRNLDVADWYKKLIAIRKRFVAEGILTPRCFSVRTHSGNNYFELRYEDHTQDRALSVHVRLQSPSGGQTGTVTVPVSGEILLDSEQRKYPIRETAALGPNEALVINRVDKY